MPAFPGAELLPFQLSVWSVTVPDRLFTAAVKHTAVVARKDDERIVGHPERFQGLKNLPNGPVELLHKIAVQPALAFALKIGMRGKRMMDIVAGIIEEKRLLLYVHPVERLSGQMFRTLFIDVQSVSRLASNHIHHSRVCGIFLRVGYSVRFSAFFIDKRISRIEPDDAVVFGIDKWRMRVDDRDAVKIVKPDFERPRLELLIPVRLALVPKPEMPFPDTGGRIAFAFEQAREGGLLRIDNQFILTKNWPIVVNAERILARKQCIARGRADRRGRVRIREKPPLLGEPVDVRRF